MEGESGILTSKHEGGQAIRELKRRLYEWALPLSFFFFSIYLPINLTINSAILYNSYIDIPEDIVVLFGFALVAAGHHILVFRWSLERHKRAGISLVLILSGLLTVVAGSHIGFIITDGSGTPLFIYGIFLGFIPFFYLIAYIMNSGVGLEKMECPSCGKMIPYQKGGEHIRCRFCGWTFDKISLQKLIEDSIR